MSLRRRGIRHLALFGSLARGDDRPDSDIDIAVDIEPGRPFSLIRMEDTRLLLQDALGRPVDPGGLSAAGAGSGGAGMNGIRRQSGRR